MLADIVQRSKDIDHKSKGSNHMMKHIVQIVIDGTSYYSFSKLCDSEIGLDQIWGAKHDEIVDF